MTNGAGMPRDRARNGVRSTYIPKPVKDTVEAWQASKRGWRKLAEALNTAYGLPVLTAPTVRRLLVQGIEPADPDKRAALGLPVYKATPVCPRHGVVHVGKCKREKLSLAKLLARKGATEKIARILAWAEGDRR